MQVRFLSTRIMVGILAIPVSRPVAMTHPGIAHSRAELEFVKARLAAGQEPWKTAWSRLEASRFAALSWTARPIANVQRGVNNSPNIGGDDFMDDGTAAYTHALRWSLSGNQAHARKAMDILNAWSSTLKSVSNHDARLLVGMGGHQHCNAAELLRHTWTGWPEPDQDRFRAMLSNVFYPVIRDFLPWANGNWDAAMIQTMMSMGVFLDDTSMFNRAVNHARAGETNGAINLYINDIGESQESGRDQNHTQMGLGYLATSCEVAWGDGHALHQNGGGAEKARGGRSGGPALGDPDVRGAAGFIDRPRPGCSAEPEFGPGWDPLPDGKRPSFPLGPGLRSLRSGGPSGEDSEYGIPRLVAAKSQRKVAALKVPAHASG